jgi:hypothetical protein
LQQVISDSLAAAAEVAKQGGRSGHPQQHQQQQQRVAIMATKHPIPAVRLACFVCLPHTCCCLTHLLDIYGQHC